MSGLEARAGFLHLPPLEGFTWTSVDRVNQYLAPMQGHVIFDRHVSGYLVWAYLDSDSPDIVVRLDVHADGIYEVVTSLRQLYERGFIDWEPATIRLKRYSDRDRVYVATLSPLPWLPANGRVYMEVRNPTRTPIRYNLMLRIYEYRGVGIVRA